MSRTPGLVANSAQQGELGGREVDEVPGLGDLAGRNVDLDVAGHNERRLRGVARCWPAASERGVDPGQQLLDAERLGHVVVGTEVERPHLVGLRPPG